VSHNPPDAQLTNIKKTIGFYYELMMATSSNYQVVSLIIIFFLTLIRSLPCLDRHVR
jgi:hypothetical protein